MEDPAVVVRPGRTADAEAAVGVLAEAFTGYPWTAWTVGADDHTARLRGQYDAWWRTVVLPYAVWWVAEVDGRVCAAAAGLPGHRPRHRAGRRAGGLGHAAGGVAPSSGRAGKRLCETMRDLLCAARRCRSAEMFRHHAPVILQ